MQHQKNKKRKQKKSSKSKNAYTYSHNAGYQPDNVMTKYFEKNILKNKN